MTTTPLDPERAAEVRSLADLLGGVLERVIGGYAQAGVELPERRYWTLGTPAADCEQVVVSFVQAYIGPPGDEAGSPQRCTSPRSANMNVQVIRCIPTMGARGRAPSEAAIQGASEQLAIDAWLLLDLAGDLDMWDPIGPGLGVIATVETGEPQGGFQAVTLNITMAIP